MANANANRTMALGSEGYLIPRRGLPSPSATFGGPASQGGPMPQGQQPLTAPVTTGRRAGYNTRYPTLSVGEIQSQRSNPVSAWYGATGQPVPRGTVLNVAGYRSSGLERGGRIGSAAGALGSSGIPTSQRGRLEKYGADPMTGEGAWQQPSWMVGQQQREQFGLSPSWAYGNMGQLPYSGASPVGSNPTSPRGQASTSQFRNTNAVEGQRMEGDDLRSTMKRLAGPAASAVGGMLGIPGSFFGTSVIDMLNRQKLW